MTRAFLLNRISETRLKPYALLLIPTARFRARSWEIYFLKVTGLTLRGITGRFAHAIKAGRMIPHTISTRGARGRTIHRTAQCRPTASLQERRQSLAGALLAGRLTSRRMQSCRD